MSRPRAFHSTGHDHQAGRGDDGEEQKRGGVSLRFGRSKGKLTGQNLLLPSRGQERVLRQASVGQSVWRERGKGGGGARKETPPRPPVGRRRRRVMATAAARGAERAATRRCPSLFHAFHFLRAGAHTDTHTHARLPLISPLHRARATEKETDRRESARTHFKTDRFPPSNARASPSLSRARASDPVLSA